MTDFIDEFDNHINTLNTCLEQFADILCDIEEPFDGFLGITLDSLHSKCACYIAQSDENNDSDNIDNIRQLCEAFVFFLNEYRSGSATIKKKISTKLNRTFNGHERWESRHYDQRIRDGGNRVGIPFTFIYKVALPEKRILYEYEEHYINYEHVRDFKFNNYLEDRRLLVSADGNNLNVLRLFRYMLHVVNLYLITCQRMLKLHSLY